MTDAPRISDAPLREKVARALAIQDDEEFGEHSWDSYLPMADAAIRVCREHFAGVAEAENKLPAELRCLDHATANAIASAIRAEGK